MLTEGKMGFPTITGASAPGSHGGEQQGSGPVAAGTSCKNPMAALIEYVCQRRIQSVAFDYVPAFDYAFGPWVDDCTKSDLSNLLSIAESLLAAMPGCFDDEMCAMISFYDIGDASRVRNTPYPCYFWFEGRDDVPEYDDVKAKLARFEFVLHLCLGAAGVTVGEWEYEAWEGSDAGVTVGEHGEWADLGIDGWEGFRNFFEDSGVAYQLEALNAGVPLDYILAR